MIVRVQRDLPSSFRLGEPSPEGEPVLLVRPEALDTRVLIELCDALAPLAAPAGSQQTA